MEIVSNVAASRLVAQQRVMDVIADNIANANTPGFKTERMQFSDWLSKQRGTDVPQGGRSIAYTQDRATWRDLQRGHADAHRQSVRSRASPATDTSPSAHRAGHA